MIRKSKISAFRILICLILFLLIGYLVFIVDQTHCLFNPIFYPSNYSDIVLTIWQVQSSLSTVSIAVVTLIISRIEKTFLGLHLKDVLYISRSLFLSYWETVIFCLIWVTLTCVAVILESIAYALYMLIVTTIFTVYIAYESITVLTNRKKYQVYATSFINRQLDVLNKSNFDKKSSGNSNIKKPARIKPKGNSQISLLTLIIQKLISLYSQVFLKHSIPWKYINDNPELFAQINKSTDRATSIMQDIVANIGGELSDKIRNGISIESDDTYLFLIDLYRNCQKDNQVRLNKLINHYLLVILQTAIEQKQFAILPSLLGLSYRYSLDNSVDAGYKILSAYYKNDISPTAFMIVIDNLCADTKSFLNLYADLILAFCRIFVLKSEPDLLRRMLNAVYIARINESSNQKGYIFLTVYFYIYYLGLKEQLFLRDHDELKVNSILELTGIEVQVEYVNGIRRNISFEQIVKNKKMIFSAMGKLYQEIKGSLSDWEYMSPAEPKRMRLSSDFLEFACYYCICFFEKEDSSILKNFPTELLIEIFQYITNADRENSNFYGYFKKFTNWMKISAADFNSDLTAYLTQIIKSHWLDEANRDRDDDFLREDMINAHAKLIAQNLKTSDLYIAQKPKNVETAKIEVASLEFLRDYAVNRIASDNGDIIRRSIEESYFRLISHHFFPQSSSSSTTSDTSRSSLIKRRLTHSRKLGLNIDTVYNNEIIDILNFEAQRSKSDLELITLLRNLKPGGSWETASTSSVFVDSKKSKLGFLFNEDSFVVISEELTDEEIKHEMQKYKDERGDYYYQYSDSLMLRFSKDELYSILKSAMFKLVYQFEAIVPFSDVGFIVTYM